MNEKTREAEALDRFLDDLMQDPDTPAPLTNELDAETVAMARRIVAVEQDQARNWSEAATQARVWTRVQAAHRQSHRIGINFLPRRWLRAGMIAVSLVLVIAIGLYAWMSQPAPVSAQEIIEKARATSNAPAASGVSSFALIETGRIVPVNPRLRASGELKAGEQIQTETRRWFQAPNRWRSEFQQTTFSAAGNVIDTYRNLFISDGTDLWQYEPANNTVIVNALDPAMNGKEALSLFGQDVANLNTLFEQARTCFDPQVIGTAMIAGRATYIIDLGPTKCPSASGPEMNGRLVVWIDKETFFVLKQEQHSIAGDKIILTREVTQIQYNGSIDATVFTFTPPAGATIADNRPKPAPSTGQFQQQLAQLAKQVEFPIFAPTYLPSGLAPRQPKFDPLMDNSVELSYFPTSEPDKDSLASLQKGLTIRELRATNSLVARWTEGADSTTLDGKQGWLRRGVRNADGTGSDSAVLVLRDGVLISISSFAIAPEELVKVASSLQTVPGSRAPLPNPTPPTLAELRQRGTFPIFVPTFVPAGLTPEQPTGGELPGENVTIKYHTADGAVGLIVVSGNPDGSPGLSMMKSEDIKLPNGITAHLIRQRTTIYGGMTLWWQQDGTLVNISGPNLTQDQLLKIAASMSKTANLGKVEPVLVRPTPTPLPPLSYKILRPTWLPEQMTVREQRDGDTITLGFDPRPNDAPHNVLTLTEMPKSMISPSGKPDPQETREQIGGRTVTIIKRGQNCITLTWDVGELNLTLTNPYDPPGQPRYSCEQLRKIVESVQ